MTAYSQEDDDISAIMEHFEAELRRDEVKRRELASAVRRKDESAVRKIAAAVWKGIKVVAPIALSILLSILGMPSN